ncbi:flagellar hook protein FlgE [Marinobacter sp. X15-166B]|uniref:flagellar hook protein FlgE n=1 Tax=Marinobacter sp. X15-166B TaxID=1897620 RepID=UPI00085BC2F0|nr:flagellar hook protein FlgE [Marinobacter sp. X15-166B]OEY67360.1 flagellar biosynthesis protein FlgE [Marinobacter sp. X15-166B]
MSFNTGLSGLRAASVDLDVTGNNIANASTVGFKGSRVQFGDLYASGFLGGGSNPVGDGVNVLGVKQGFGQGNISFTDNGLDLAINGNGFFMLNNGGEVRYSRAGQFGINKDGFVVNNQNMRVQGYQADNDGNLSGVRGDLQIDSSNLAPQRTTNLTSDLNLDSREQVLERRTFVLGEVGQTEIGAGATAFNAEMVFLNYGDGSTAQVQINANSSAADVVAQLGQGKGVSASATTEMTMPGGLNDAFVQAAGFSFELRVEGVTVPVDTSGVNDLSSLADAINNSSSTSVSASVVSNQLRVVDNRGHTLEVEFYDTDPSTAQTETQVGTVRVQTTSEVTGFASYQGVNPDPSTAGAGLFQAAWDDGTLQVANQFNPQDQRTYNHATSTTIYDSLGNPHVLTQYFVKNEAPGNGVGVSQWSVYLQVDGEYVGNTGQTPQVARFNQDGSLQSVNGDVNGEIVIGDWTPKDPAGMPNGADGPPPAGVAVVTPIPDPPVSSAFVINLGETTQYGSSFGVNDQRQNGYTTGRLSGLDVSDEGVLFARYTNGQSQALGQVALASFNNVDGLSPIGDTSWVETFASGQAIIGQPGTGTLGAIKSSSVEESNVDLSAELVNLIIAQRNYQANAKTIETSDAVTQTIINLR